MHFLPTTLCVRRLTLLAGLLVLAPAARAGEVEIRPVEVVETKAVYGRVETRTVVPARARLGGTLVELTVTEGDAVSEGQPIARVVDDKLALQLNALEAKIRAAKSETANAQAEFERTRSLIERGVSTQQRLDQVRTQLEVARNQVAAAEAERSVLLQQGIEGTVTAPLSGRVVKAPITRGSVVMPGEQIALVAGGGYFLRLALPERHAQSLKLGAEVQIGEAGTGRLAKVFPQIENGRVIADVEVADLGTYFVGARLLVHVPVGTRRVLAVPRAAVETRSGVDTLRLTGATGPHEVAVVTGGAVPLPGGPGVEILSGLRAGDRVVLP